jgi:hypothetical protein
MHRFPETLISVIRRLFSADEAVRERTTEMIIAPWLRTTVAPHGTRVAHD